MNVIAMRYKPGKSRKKSSSGNHAGKDIAAAIRENRGMFFLALLFLAGMVMGAIYARNASYDILKRLDFLFACNYKAKTTQSFLSIFIASIEAAKIARHERNAPGRITIRLYKIPLQLSTEYKYPAVRPNPKPRKAGITGIKNAPHMESPQRKHDKIKIKEEANEAIKILKKD